jgi:hypothetical protein
MDGARGRATAIPAVSKRSTTRWIDAIARRLTTMTRNIPGMPGYRYLTPAEKLAGAFAKEIREALSPEMLNRVRILNRESPRYGEDRACATHNFIDANVCMLDAFKKTFPGTEPDPASQAVANLMNEAWSLAKKEGFRA